MTVAKEVLKDYTPHEGLWPSEHIPTRRAAYRDQFLEYLDNEVLNAKAKTAHHVVDIIGGVLQP